MIERKREREREKERERDREREREILIFDNRKKHFKINQAVTMMKY